VRSFVLVACLFFVSAAAHATDSSAATFICGAVADAVEHKECMERAAFATTQASAHSIKDVSAVLDTMATLRPIAWVVYYGFGLLIACYIYRDASNREWAFLGIRPLWWALLTVFSPVMGLLVYWLMHYSRLVQSYTAVGKMPDEDM
jgi:RsiW-degrading membrane proteinase PrsW (M82 family)